MHWSKRIDDRTCQYMGKVADTISDKIDGAPGFDGRGTLYFTTLKNFPGTSPTTYAAKFDDELFNNINNGGLEYAPAISADGLEMFFTRVGKVDGRLKMVGIFPVCNYFACDRILLCEFCEYFPVYLFELKTGALFSAPNNQA